MARIRTSLTSAEKFTKELMETENMNLDDAAHKAALTFNENEQEIKDRIKFIEEREQRKTGKVGRPPKRILETVSEENNEDNEDNQIVKNKSNFVYSGPVLIKNQGMDIELNLRIETGTNNYEDALMYILKYFYDKQLIAYITPESLKKNFLQ